MLLVIFWLKLLSKLLIILVFVRNLKLPIRHVDIKKRLHESCRQRVQAFISKSDTQVKWSVKSYEEKLTRVSTGPAKKKKMEPFWTNVAKRWQHCQTSTVQRTQKATEGQRNQRTSGNKMLRKNWSTARTRVSSSAGCVGLIGKMCQSTGCIHVYKW